MLNIKKIVQNVIKHIFHSHFHPFHLGTFPNMGKFAQRPCNIQRFHAVVALRKMSQQCMSTSNQQQIVHSFLIRHHSED